MAKNKNLHKAMSNKKDEFYTQLVDIENELKHYRSHFHGKVVYCNCDDPEISNFYHYFHQNFARLELRQLITTCYKNQNRKMFSQHDKDTAIGLRYDGTDMFADKFHLKGDGDFRSSECIELLKESDIVVTNPPFSLFREYVAQLMKYEKKFLVIGHQNAIAKRELFPLIRDKRIWLGYGFKGGASHFIAPNYEDYAVAGEHREGMIRVSGVAWFTNLDHAKRNEELILYKKYSPEEYPTYFNFDAIEVSKVKDIPYDFDGMMGVPITFMSKFNPQQFEIVGWAQGTLGKEIGVKPWTPEHRKHRKEVDKKIPIDGNIYMIKEGEIVEPYARIIIRKI